jgi:hypothetical protein
VKRSRIEAVIVTAILASLAVLFVRAVRKTEISDYYLPVAIPAAMLGVAAFLSFQGRLLRRLWWLATVRPSRDAGGDYDDGEHIDATPRRVAGRALGCLRGTVRAVFFLPLLLSPGLAALLATVEQSERAQRRAITQVYGEAAYASGLRIDIKRRLLSTGAPADPAALDLAWPRPFLPEIAALVLTLVTADCLLRHYYGEGYNATRPVIDLARVRRGLASWWRGPGPAA